MTSYKQGCTLFQTSWGGLVSEFKPSNLTDCAKHHFTHEAKALLAACELHPKAALQRFATASRHSTTLELSLLAQAANG